MIKTFLTHDKVISGQEKLQSFLDESEGQLNWEPYIAEALQDLINDLISSGYMVRQLCIPLILQELITVVGTKTSATSDEDRVQRQILYFNATSVDDNVFVLQGSSDNSEWNNILEFTATEPGSQTLYLTDLFKYYRLKKTDANSCTYEASLYERIYESLHLYKTRAKIYNSLISLPDDVYTQLRDANNEMYRQILDQTRFMYDRSDDGKVDVEEAETNYNTYEVGL